MKAKLWCNSDIDASFCCRLRRAGKWLRKNL